MAGIDDIILRITSSPPLTTKGSKLTFAELDNNFIQIYNALVAQYISSYIPDYDAGGDDYDDVVNNYAFYDSKIYKWVNPIAGNTTPGSSDWLLVWAAELAHRKNSDTMLDEGGANKVTAEEIKAVLTGDHVFPYFIMPDNGSPVHLWKWRTDSTGQWYSDDLGPA